MALENRGFDLVAIYGAETCRDSLHQGEAVRGPLAASFDTGG